jgi:hypothetical protein
VDRRRHNFGMNAGPPLPVPLSASASFPVPPSAPRQPGETPP